MAPEGLAGLEGDRSGRLGDPATIADVWPGHPAEAWTGMVPQRLWEACVSRRGPLTLREPPRHRRGGHAAYTLTVTADGDSQDAWTRALHAEALRPWTPERLDRRQPRRAVRTVHRWRVDGA